MNADLQIALAAYDATVKLCPVAKPSFDTRNACPDCGATAAQSCARGDRAGYALAESVRQILGDQE